MDTKPTSYILPHFSPSLPLLPYQRVQGALLSSTLWVFLFGWPSRPPPTTHTQTQSMHFRQGANGKINYQQAKALALHFCRREGNTWGSEKKGVVKKWKERRVGGKNKRQAQIAPRLTQREAERREKMEKMRKRQ